MMPTSLTSDLCDLCPQAYLSELGELVREGRGGEEEDEECAVEALGILGNLALPEVDYDRVLSELQLLPFIVETLKVDCFFPFYLQ